MALRRILVVTAAAALVAGLSARLAFAQTKLVGSGVVVIETTLGYQGGQAAGTGMVLTPSGEILTNNHVIRGATAIRVVVPGTGRSYAATVAGYDVGDDVAVLKARASSLKPIALGNSAAVRVGQAVTGVGNAGGTGALAPAVGRVTGLARAITVSDDQGGSERLTGLIETNAAIQPGDSGGPLLSAAGRVIGMDTAASVGFGFQQDAASDSYAIPINKAAAIAKRIAAGQSSAAVHVGGTAFLGVQISASYDGSGVVVGAVVPGGPADSAGIAAGDLITSVAGHAVPSPAALSALVAAQKPGAQVAVGYVDATGATQTTTVTLATGPAV